MTSTVPPLTEIELPSLRRDPGRRRRVGGTVCGRRSISAQSGHVRRRRRRQPRPDRARRAAAGRDRRAARPRRRAVRRAGDGQPRRRDRRWSAGHAGRPRRSPRTASAPRSGRRMETAVVATADDDDVGTIRLYLDRHAAGRRPHPAGQPHQAAHAVPRSDRERLHEDGRRRLRQAARRGRVPRHRAARHARPPAGGRHRRAAGDRPAARRRGIGRGAVRRRRRRPGAEGRRGRRRQPNRALTRARPGAACPACRSTRSTCSSSSRAARTSPGTTIDPNVTGRFWIDGLADPAQAARARRSSCSALTPTTAGQRAGHRLRRLRARVAGRAIDWQQTYVNCFTAGRPASGAAACRWSCPTRSRASAPRCDVRQAFDEPKRVVRIRSTLHLTRCWVSDALLDELPGVTAPGHRSDAVARRRADA